MYLSKIELHGFKSFAQRTTLHFDPGITAIVGPNGCGKSNIVDAVRWVLGEQRARLLRSEKMENVIFNGTTKRRALGMAEVSLTIENTRNVLPTEYSEVTLTRRLYRSGESEYLLNKSLCRLKDILDLFMDTGMGANAYSIIELKMIDDILSESPEDRRRLFEEAAGITKYKLRRTQALRKLDATQADLTRIRDLTAEIEKQVRSLERQAAKASRYKKLRAKLEHFELALAQAEHQRFTTQRADLQSEIEALRSKIEEHSNRQSVEEATLESHQKALLDRERALSESQRDLNRHLEAVRRLESDLRLLQERETAATSNLERAAQEQQETRERLVLLSEERARLGESVAQSKPRLETASAALAEAARDRDRANAATEQQRERLRKLRADEEKAVATLAKSQNELNRLANRSDLIEQEIARIEAHLNTSSAETSALERTAEEARKAVSSSSERVREAEVKLSEARRRSSSKRSELDDATTQLQALQRQMDALAAETRLLKSLISSFDEFSDTVKFLATTASWSAAAPTTVADIISCREEDRLAIDAALGEYAQCFVVGSDDEAKAAISLLRAEQKGQAGFFVLNRLPEYSGNGLPTGHNGARPAIDLVEISSPDHDKLIRLLLKDYYVVESLKDAEDAVDHHRRDWPAARFVARSGEWATVHGLLSGGSRQAEQSGAASRMSRREQYDVAQMNLAAVEKQIQKQMKTVEALRCELDAIEVTEREEALKEAQEAKNNAAQASDRAIYELSSRKRQQTEQEQRLRALRQDLENSKALIGDLRGQVVDAQSDQSRFARERVLAEEALQKAEAESRAVLARYSETNVTLVEARNVFENYQKDLARIEHEMASLQSRVQARSEEMRQLEKSIADGKARQIELKRSTDNALEDKTRIEEAVNRAETEVVSAKSAISEVEAGLRDIRRLREQLIREESTVQSRIAETQARMENLVDRVEAEYGIHPSEVRFEDDGETFDEVTAREQIPQIRDRIRSLGAVNELAVDDYEAEKARLEFMIEQKEDLENAEGTLITTIKEINTTAAIRFDETFDQIRSHFSSIFSELFTEGDAEVFLTGKEDPLESPIEIVARPRGKKPSTISQLSGGEKTLTAIALLFAIYLVKPSPFCILDEVDAPLDDANVERFMRLIRQFAESTQFILVTHNKRTMEAADRMYGITMQEEGVSSLVGVKFDETLEMAKEAGAEHA